MIASHYDRIFNKIVNEQYDDMSSYESEMIDSASTVNFTTWMDAYLTRLGIDISWSSEHTTCLKKWAIKHISYHRHMQNNAIARITNDFYQFDDNGDLMRTHVLFSYSVNSNYQSFDTDMNGRHTYITKTVPKVGVYIHNYTNDYIKRKDDWRCDIRKQLNNSNIKFHSFREICEDDLSYYRENELEIVIDTSYQESHKTIVSTTENVDPPTYPV
jgi:hypothetical protein